MNRSSCLLFLLLCAPGCSGGAGGFDLVPISGTVTLDGEPLAEALVVFQPELGRPSSGITDSEGRYTLRYTDEKAGALPGPNTVSITTGRERDRDSDDPEVQRGRKERVPPKYNRNTTLTVDVAAGQQEPVNFALTTN